MTDPHDAPPSPGTAVGRLLSRRQVDTRVIEEAGVAAAGPKGGSSAMLQRLFAGADHGTQLRQRREAALRAMDFLHAFAPRLCGPVLDGTADTNSPVQVQVHSDDADAVQRFLEEHGIPAESRMRRLRLDRERSLDVPVWVFSAEDLTFDIAVLPYDALRQPPLSAIDEKPMRRASVAQLRQVLAEAEIEGYLAG